VKYVYLENVMGGLYFVDTL